MAWRSLGYQENLTAAEFFATEGARVVTMVCIEQGDGRHVRESFGGVCDGRSSCDKT